MNFLRNRKGISIVEIMIIVAIIGIISTISVPFFRDAAMSLSLSGAARNLASDLRYAQQLSVTTQINHSVVFDVANNDYSIINTDTSSEIKSGKIDPPIFIQSISEALDDTATFNATGAATSTGSIILANSEGRTTTIEIKPSGYVEIY